MSYFDTEQDVYDHVGRLLADVVADEEVGPRLCRADMVVRYEHTEPEATITVSLREGEPPRIELGPSELEPDVTMRMSADVAHRFWLGEVNVPVALTRGQIQAEGSVRKLLRVMPLTTSAIPRYRQLLLDEGRADLVEV